METVMLVEVVIVEVMELVMVEVMECEDEL